MDRASDGHTMIGLLDNKDWTIPSAKIRKWAPSFGSLPTPLEMSIRCICIWFNFQLLNRQPFDTKTYLQTGKPVFTNIPIPPPESNEHAAWKDTRSRPTPAT
jgi:hypothetical protein